ncbi:hypothetical protein LOK49_LG05G02359 [Camellia lanceoleosa]|uniref:Uncharacterized protein n=1 Tax=Camellia lanceoleosa TaxID=1840588 RepID=A0ACC0HRB7_9ERIC|nr:hypothetical protein LOK49_LG05G02359 [Camellia lanceoleosa]
MVIFSDLHVISDQNISKICKVTILTTKQCSLYCCNGLGCFCFNFHQGDNVPPPLTSFEATGFPSELLRELCCLEQDVVGLNKALLIGHEVGFKGATYKALLTVVEFALALQEAGCFFVVLKCVLAPVAVVAATTSAF